MSMVQDLPPAERPREKGLHYGVEFLSNRELLAILIRCGTKGQSAMDSADLLLQKAGGIKGIPRLSRNDIAAIRGFSCVKALELEACVELARRFIYAEASEKDCIEEPESVIRWLQLKIGIREQENVLVLFLNTAHRILSSRTLFIGTIDFSPVSPREIYQEALRVNSKNIILVHNHPSGSLVPSQEDISLTERVCDAGNLVGIQLLDHLIVTDSGWFSFRREGFM